MYVEERRAGSRPRAFPGIRRCPPSRGPGDAVLQGLVGAELHPDGVIAPALRLDFLDDLAGEPHPPLEISPVLVFPAVGVRGHERADEIRVPAVHFHAVEADLLRLAAPSLHFLNKGPDLLTRELFRHPGVKGAGNCRRRDGAPLGRPAAEEGELEEDLRALRMDAVHQVLEARA